MNDHLTGFYFWWDSAPRSKRNVYHGRVTEGLEGGYYLLAFTPCDELPAGLHEIVHISTMVADNWSFYRTEADYQLDLSKRAMVTDAA